MLYIILRALSALIAFFLFRLEVKGKENIPKIGGFILASNHSSNLDPVLLGVACPRLKLNYMGKRELFPNPLAAWFMSALHVFPVRRDIADIGAIKESIKRVVRGEGLLLFPQGGRQEDITETKALAGVGFLAQKTKAPVIPAFISGTNIAMPKGSKSIKSGKISVYFGKPCAFEIEAQGREISVKNKMPYQEFAGIIMHRIRRLGGVV